MAPKDSRWTTEQLETLFHLEKERVQALIDVIRDESAAKIAFQRDEATAANNEETKAMLLIRIEQLEKVVFELEKMVAGIFRGLTALEKEKEKGGASVVFVGAGHAAGAGEKTFGRGGLKGSVSGVEEEWLDIERGDDNGKKLPLKKR